ncbi:type II toxin-antitoxin system VapC family toxin [Chamaesiphon polymorphus]|uniref:Ribonuclease VapC n=1 Tax=Chamaesiphon polymorphus CCALA 037 TaxID=2107692 RepID=A0A2T1G2P6_9CYAN|nr:type II toxin-antitoxin system VapC family toxin [Chamaesiphon polymorphus]PSB51512.1 VapC toxin family PIN domain ribonuclease [Chamaesiphon polymorphus CCALA 037]
MAIVADTHAIVWYLVEPERLSQVALDALEGSIAAGSPVYISAISLIEICYLIEKRRIATDLLQRILAVLNDPNPSLVVVPIDLAISIAIREIDRDTVPDMPDRIIAATALHLNFPLVTRDRKIQAEGAIVTIW